MAEPSPVNEELKLRVAKAAGPSERALLLGVDFDRLRRVRRKTRLFGDGLLAMVWIAVAVPLLVSLDLGIAATLHYLLWQSIPSALGGVVVGFATNVVIAWLIGKATDDSQKGAIAAAVVFAMFLCLEVALAHAVFGENLWAYSGALLGLTLAVFGSATLLPTALVHLLRRHRADTVEQVHRIAAFPSWMTGIDGSALWLVMSALADAFFVAAVGLTVLSTPVFVVPLAITYCVGSGVGLWLAFRGRRSCSVAVSIGYLAVGVTFALATALCRG